VDVPPQLTDFMSLSTPVIEVCSLSDMLSVTPRDILTRLRLLFIVVCVLFGGMNLGALYGWILDHRSHRAFLARLQAPEVGFRVVGGKVEAERSIWRLGAGDDGATWLWRFQLRQLRDDIAPPAGPALALCVLMGLPVARLRACLPDEMLSWGMGEAVGRKHAFSSDGFASTFEAARALKPAFCSLPHLPHPWRRHRTQRGMKMQSPLSGDAEVEAAAAVAQAEAAEAAQAAADAEAAAEAAAAEAAESEEARTREEFIGTALVIAFLQAASLMPVVEIAKRKSAAKRHFAGVTTHAGWDFDKTSTDFVTLLSPGILNVHHKWLINARLWRFMMSQEPDGSWGASSTIAFALEARSLFEVNALPRSLLARLSALLSAVLAFFTGGGVGGLDGAGGKKSSAAQRDLLPAGNAAQPAPLDPMYDDDVAAEKAKEKEKASPAPASRVASLMASSQQKKDDEEAPPPASPRASQSQSQSQPPHSPPHSPRSSHAASPADGAHDAALLPDARKHVFDCPLTCHGDSITALMPRRLARLPPEVDAARVWTTLCAVASLERLPVCWAWGDGDLFYEDEKTIVDAGREWVEVQAAVHPSLAAALADGEVLKRAAAVTATWRDVSTRRVHELRRHKAILDQMGESQAHRTLVGIYRAFVTEHSTFRVFLSEPLDGLQRWQSASRAHARRPRAHACLLVPLVRPHCRPLAPASCCCAVFMIIVTLVIEQLLVNVRVRRAAMRAGLPLRTPPPD
jgi:hypothetical protein